MKDNIGVLISTIFVWVGLLSELIMVIFIPLIILLSFLVYRLLSINFFLFFVFLVLILAILFLLKVKRDLFVSSKRLKVKNLLGRELLSIEFGDISSVHFNMNFNGMYNAVEFFIDYKVGDSIETNSFAILPNKQKVERIIECLKSEKVLCKVNTKN